MILQSECNHVSPPDLSALCTRHTLQAFLAFLMVLSMFESFISQMKPSQYQGMFTGSNASRSRTKCLRTTFLSLVPCGYAAS
jgi:hypothetical protein